MRAKMGGRFQRGWSSRACYLAAGVLVSAGALAGAVGLVASGFLFVLAGFAFLGAGVARGLADGRVAGGVRSRADFQACAPGSPPTST